MATKKKIITEKELLSMSEDEYMNEDQLAFFRARLEAMEAQLRHNAGQTTETLRQTQLAPDPLDRATIEEEHALELRTRDRERKLLKKVQAAIKRIDEGEYGWCAETGEPIGVARLLARPTATLSLEAQQRRELKQKVQRLIAVPRAVCSERGSPWYTGGRSSFFVYAKKIRVSGNRFPHEALDL